MKIEDGRQETADPHISESPKGDFVMLQPPDSSDRVSEIYPDVSLDYLPVKTDI